MLLMAALFGIFIAGAGFGIVLWWRQQHANFLIARYQDELKHRVLVQHFDTLAQHANDIVLLMDEAGRLREVNDKAVSSYGYSREEFLALNVKDLRALETQAILPRQMQEVADRDGLVFETIHVRKNGSRFPAEVSARVIKVGGKRFIQSIVRDITQRKHIEADLREREAQYRSLFENLREAIISLDMNGQVQLANPAAAMMLNYESPHAMLGLSAADVFLKRAQAKNNGTKVVLWGTKN
jgi:PAS domain S-box-containing protein